MQQGYRRCSPAIMNANQQLVDASGLLKALFEERCRPSLRWLRDQQKAGAIPCRRLGRLVFFDLEEVRAALAVSASEAAHNPPPATSRTYESDTLNSNMK